LEKLFHISEEPGIKIFIPRKSPQFYKQIKGNVVFAVSDKMLHNYLLPRDCPRVCFYAGEKTSETDRDKFIGKSLNKYIISVEERWKETIKRTKLYKYKFSFENFELLDDNAGYFISYSSQTPVNVTVVEDLFLELEERNVELRFLPSIIKLAEETANSTLNYSIMRLRNARH
jgi:hypothetical protein